MFVMFINKRKQFAARLNEHSDYISAMKHCVELKMSATTSIHPVRNSTLGKDCDSRWTKIGLYLHYPELSSPKKATLCKHVMR